ncbi:MAG: hypothetical protein JWP97_2175 [Labilithrix sp.]|nr:hypothetical protein [Labilithrix sp.]
MTMRFREGACHVRRSYAPPFGGLSARSRRRVRSPAVPLYWFHAFDRPDLPKIIEVLRDGPKHHPLPTSETRRNEAELGIEPPHVYAYLGRTLKSFGQNAIALKQPALEGEVCPFDSGGLLRKIAPVSGRKKAAKAAYLQAYSWPTTALRVLLKTYPSSSQTQHVAYVAMAAPAVDGPHVYWPKRGAAEPIWTSNTQWRAWTWEGRSPSPLTTGKHLVRWTCPNDTYPKLEEYVASRPPSDRKWFEQVSKLYVRGGLTRLMTALRAAQETP